MAGGKGGGQGGRGAKPGSHRKGAQIGSGGQGRKGLRGKGPTPPAEKRTAHPAAKRAARAAGRRTDEGRRDDPRRGEGGRPRDTAERKPRGGTGRGARSERTEAIAGRNPVVEALRAAVPATALYIAPGADRDARGREAIDLAADLGIAVLEAGRLELDRMTGGAVHQGLALQVPPYDYLHPDDLLARLDARAEPGLVVALDGVTDPHNLGAVVRSAAAFGGHGVLIPERRSAGMTVTAWKASAGAAARLPVARATNLTRTLDAYAKAGLMIVGLAADGDVDVTELDVATGPLVLVVGAEGDGLSRLVSEHCDLLARIPITATTESLNASVAAGVALYEVARRRASADSNL